MSRITGSSTSATTPMMMPTTFLLLFFGGNAPVAGVAGAGGITGEGGDAGVGLTDVGGVPLGVNGGCGGFWFGVGCWGGVLGGIVASCLYLYYCEV